MSEMIEVKASELIGAALDWAVSKVEGVDVVIIGPAYGCGWRLMSHSIAGAFRPSTDWSQGGPLIDKYHMDFCCEHPETIGSALCDENGMYIDDRMMFGENPPHRRLPRHRCLCNWRNRKRAEGAAVMTVDKARLKAHAESLEAKDAEGRGETKHAMYITATDMLEMLAEIERLEGQVRLSKTAIEMAVQGVVGRGLNDYIAVSMERDQLKAELAGLKTGYEAYERVNAELRAECEGLRKDAERYRWLKVDDVDRDHLYTSTLGVEMDAAIDAAMSKEASHD